MGQITSLTYDMLMCYFSVYEKEKLRGRDPLAPDDTPFDEYTAGYVSAV